MNNKLGSGQKLQAALLPAPCCNHECRQGRDCPNAESETVAKLAVYTVTAISVVAGIVHLAARMGWV